MSSTPDDLRRRYRHRFDEAPREAGQRLWNLFVESFFQKLSAPSTPVLDLGWGLGEFLNPLRCGPLPWAWWLFGRQFLVRAVKP